MPFHIGKQVSQEFQVDLSGFYLSTTTPHVSNEQGWIYLSGRSEIATSE